MEHFNIVIDNNVINNYTDYYFAKHPRAKKKPIERPIHPSMNVYFSMKNRMQKNDLKQKWKEFTIWLVEELGLTGRGLDSFEMDYCVYMPTKRRFDLDNLSPKFLCDGFTESGFIVDDDCSHLKKLTIHGGYDKDNPRTEINITAM